jgi:asparagine synthase (glutamine-hydrolysing)
LPTDLLYRPKRGFGAPVRQWFRGAEGEDLIAQMMNSSIHKRELFDYAVLSDFTEKHRRQQLDWSENLWCLLNLSLWYDHWIGG